MLGRLSRAKRIACPSEVIVLSRRKGSVLDCLIRTLTMRGPSLKSMDMSDGVKCEVGSKPPSDSTINSPALRNPKKLGSKPPTALRRQIGLHVVTNRGVVYRECPVLWEDGAAADEMPGDALLRKGRTPNETTERQTNLRNLQKSGSDVLPRDNINDADTTQVGIRTVREWASPFGNSHTG